LDFFGPARTLAGISSTWKAIEMPGSTGRYSLAETEYRTAFFGRKASTERHFPRVFFGTERHFLAKKGAPNGISWGKRALNGISWPGGAFGNSEYLVESSHSLTGKGQSKKKSKNEPTHGACTCV
jgi:hypothetical protein